MQFQVKSIQIKEIEIILDKNKSDKSPDSEKLVIFEYD